MPLYEFHCQDCNNEFETRRSIQEADAPLECPECESRDVIRKMSVFVAFTKSDSEAASLGGGCGCGGGGCGCGGHSVN